LELDGGAYGYGGDEKLNVANLLVDSGSILYGDGSIAGGVSIVNSGGIVADGGTLMLAGTISGTGSLEAYQGAVLDLTAGGTVTEAVRGPGTLELGGTYVLGAASVTVADLLVSSVGNVTFASACAGFFGGVTNNGVISASGGSKPFLFVGAVTNDGTIGANSGIVRFDSSVSGTGTLALSTGATLCLVEGAAPGEVVAFGPPGGDLLQLYHPALFLGEIADFAGGDAIELIGQTVTSLNFASGTLTVLDNGTKIASLDFTGLSNSSTFTFVDYESASFIKLA
jgi:hypothetical protein